MKNTLPKDVEERLIKLLWSNEIMVNIGGQDLIKIKQFLADETERAKSADVSDKVSACKNPMAETTPTWEEEFRDKFTFIVKDENGIPTLRSEIRLDPNIDQKLFDFLRAKISEAEERGDEKLEKYIKQELEDAQRFLYAGYTEALLQVLKYLQQNK